MTSQSVIFDMDGTLADIGHRRHHVETKPKNWRAFNAALSADLPNAHIVQLARMYRDAGWTIIVCSGREDVYRTETVEWMERHGVPHDRLYMRPAKDYRSDDVVKAELLKQIRTDGFDPPLAVDDRDRVVAMWRANGLTCLQCAPGDF